MIKIELRRDLTVYTRLTPAQCTAAADALDIPGRVDFLERVSAAVKLCEQAQTHEATSEKEAVHV